MRAEPHAHDVKLQDRFDRALRSEDGEDAHRILKAALRHNPILTFRKIVRITPDFNDPAQIGSLLERATRPWILGKQDVGELNNGLGHALRLLRAGTVGQEDVAPAMKRLIEAGARHEGEKFTGTSDMARRRYTQRLVATYGQPEAL